MRTMFRLKESTQLAFLVCPEVTCQWGMLGPATKEGLNCIPMTLLEPRAHCSMICLSLSLSRHTRNKNKNGEISARVISDEVAGPAAGRVTFVM